MSFLRKLAGQTAVYGLSSVLGRFLNWALTPLYLHELSQTAFGQYAELYAYSFFLLIALTFGMETAFFRYADKQLDARAAYDNAWLTTAGLTAGFLLLLAATHRPLARALDYGDAPGLLLLVGGVIALDALAALPLARLRYQERAPAFALVSLVNIALTAGLNIYFLAFLGKGVAWVFVANLIASGVRCAWALALNPPRLKGYGKPAQRALAAYGGYIMITGVAGALNETLDRALLPRLWADGQSWRGKAYSGLEMNAIYAAMYKLAMFVSLFTQAFRYAAEPYFFQSAGESGAPLRYAKIFHYYMLAGMGAFMLVASFSYEIVSFRAFGLLGGPLVPEEYWTGLPAVPVLLAANVLLGAYVNLSIWFKLTGQLRFGLGLAAVGAGITLLGNMIFIPAFGFMACAWATLLCYAAMCVGCYHLGARHSPMPYNLPRLAIYAALILPGVWLNLQFYDAGLTGAKISLLKSLVCAAPAALIYFLETRRPPFPKGAEEKGIQTE